MQKVIFKKLDKPIEFQEPVNVKLNEEYKYEYPLNYISFHETIKDQGNLTNLITRQVLHAIINSLITEKSDNKKEDLTTIYRNIHIDEENKYIKITAKGSLSEDIFQVNYYGGRENKELAPCSPERYGLGFEDIFVYLRARKRIVFAFNNKIYYLVPDVDEKGNVNPRIFRGDYNTNGTITVLIEKGNDKINKDLLLYPHDQNIKYIEDLPGRVYHNGVYVGTIDLPLAINTCYAKVDEEERVIINKRFVEALGLQINSETYKEFLRVLRFYTESNGSKVTLEASKDFFYLLEFASLADKTELLGKVDEAIKKAFEEYLNFYDVFNSPVIAIDEVSRFGNDDKVAGLAYSNIPEYYVEYIKDKLKEKEGRKVTSYEEASLREVEEYLKQNSLLVLDSNDVPIVVKAAVKLGLWMYSIALRTARCLFDNKIAEGNLSNYIQIMSKLVGQEIQIDLNSLCASLYEPLPHLFKVPVRILKDGAKFTRAEGLGYTIPGVGIFLKSFGDIVTKEQLENNIALRKNIIFTLAFLVIHEMNHFTSNYPHGTYEFEYPYSILANFPLLVEDFSQGLRTLMLYAIYHPEDFVNNVQGIMSWKERVEDDERISFSSENVYVPNELIKNKQCNGYVHIDKNGVQVICNASEASKVLLAVKNGKLLLKQI